MAREVLWKHLAGPEVGALARETNGRFCPWAPSRCMARTCPPAPTVFTAWLSASAPLELVHLERVQEPSVENPRTLPFTRARVPRRR